MTKTTEALRIELEDLKNQFYEINQSFNEKIKRERVRVDRIVQVLLNTLPEEQLKSRVTFSGTDCCGQNRSWTGGYYGEKRTLRDFLLYVIDP